jgi:hypothetical protein
MSILFRMRLNVLKQAGNKPVAGADLRAALVASCLRGALPPVDLRAVCFVRAMLTENLAAKSSLELVEGIDAGS